MSMNLPQPVDSYRVLLVKMAMQESEGFLVHQ